MRLRSALASLLIAGLPLLAQTPSATQERADRFLKVVNASYQALTYVTQEAAWAAATDVKPEHDAAAEWAGKAYAAFNGNPALIQEARELLAQKAQLNAVTVKQLEWVLFNAAEGPMTNPKLVSDRITAETAQASTMNGFVWKVDGKAVSANQIDKVLGESKDAAERLKWWTASKENGPALREGLVKLRDLRNGCARELGYSDYFALQAAKHGMSSEEMLALNRKFVEVLKPLYTQLHTWVKYELAKKYGVKDVPKAIPAHWINNRWSQNWVGLVDGVSFDAGLKTWTPEQVVKTGEAFYTGLGFPKLPASFWVKSDLYPVKPGETRKKNSHASCWHLDLDTDVRSLMSVQPDFQWFETTHHELGHGYYFIAYSNPQVPALLRNSASPAFHEGMGELIALATRQIPYLQEVGVLPKDAKIDQMKALLNEALEVAIPFIAWSSGTMTEWEYEFYAKGMPADQMNKRWWEIVRAKQGVEAPSPRGEEFCDAATKTHINDNPCYYYNYAIATVFKYQMHDAICKKVLKQDVHAANYANRKDVGDFLRSWLSKGATEDWRKVLTEATGEDLSTRAMAEYFQPLVKWLEKENKKRQQGW